MQLFRLKKPLSYYLGNALIVTSLLGFFYIGYPIIRMYLFPQAPSPIVQAATTYAIAIPKINAVAPIISQVDPFDEKAYKAALKEGVAHAKGTASPGEHGTVFLFAHSSAYPWELTRYNTVFLRLYELQIRDEITIYYKNSIYHYAVSDIKEVQPTDVEYLLEKQDHALILQTCTPIGTAFRRLLVFADPI
jgi:LPXTG-site transpeptidase (sortase) family protein